MSVYSPLSRDLVASPNTNANLATRSLSKSGYDYVAAMALSEALGSVSSSPRTPTHDSLSDSSFSPWTSAPSPFEGLELDLDIDASGCVGLAHLEAVSHPQGVWGVGDGVHNYSTYNSYTKQGRRNSYIGIDTMGINMNGEYIVHPSSTSFGVFEPSDFTSFGLGSSPGSTATSLSVSPSVQTTPSTMDHQYCSPTISPSMLSAPSPHQLQNHHQQYERAQPAISQSSIGLQTALNTAMYASPSQTHTPVSVYSQQRLTGGWMPAETHNTGMHIYDANSAFGGPAGPSNLHNMPTFASAFTSSSPALPQTDFETIDVDAEGISVHSSRSGHGSGSSMDAEGSDEDNVSSDVSYVDDDDDNDDNDSDFVIGSSSSKRRRTTVSISSPPQASYSYGVSISRSVSVTSASTSRTSTLTMPVPVPNLTKKSRGRHVPTTSTLAMPSVRSRHASAGGSTIAGVGKRSYVCPVEGCGKCFARGEHLKRHTRSIHTHEKPHLCPSPGCGKLFSRRDNLRQHLKVHKGFNARAY